MEQAINAAVKLYSGDKEFGLFVCHLVENFKTSEQTFESIFDVFVSAGIVNFEKLPADIEARKKFAKDFNEL